MLTGAFLYFLGILSKSMIITLPFTLFVIDYLFHRKFDLKLFLEKIPYFLFFIAGLYLYGAFHSVQNLIAGFTVDANSVASQPVHSNPLLLQVVSISYRTFFFLIKIILPVKTSPIYMLPDFYTSHVLNIYCWVYPLAILAIAVLGIYLHKYSRTVPAGLLFFFITIIPVLAFHGSETSFVADRYDYISSIGIISIWGTGLMKILKKWKRNI